MPTNSLASIALCLLAALMAGEYYLLGHLKLLGVLQNGNRALLLLLKATYKAGVYIRLSFLVFYFLSLGSMSSASLKVERREKKKSYPLFGGYLLLFVCFGLLLACIHLPAAPYITYLYPLAVGGVLTSGLLLAPFLRKGSSGGFGVKNEKRKLENAYSFHFKTQDGWINIVNPFRGIFISGGAGSGKSFSLANPIIHQAVSKGYCGLVYDFKFPVLAEQVNKALLVNGPSDIKHYLVNFYDLTRSHRLNPLKPQNLSQVAYAEEYALAILHNLWPESIRKKDFWIRSAASILTAVIWFLKTHHPLYCSIPHVVNCLLYKDYLHVMAMLDSDEQCGDMIRSALTAIENGAENQVAGVIGTLQIAIVRINTPQICWVLSGDDFDLDLTNPADPKLLTLGNHPSLSDTFSPLISCIATVALKRMNQPGKRQSMLLLDEAPTLYIPKLEMIPATARSNKVATIYMAQDFSQMVAHYGKEVADVIIANLNNQFYGRVGAIATAKHVSDLFGREEKETKSLSTGRSLQGEKQSNSQSLSKSLQERLLVRPQDVTSLQVGEFVGMSVESKEPYFWSKILVEHIPLRGYKETDFAIPSFARGIDVQENFCRIKTEVEAIISGYEKKAINIPTKNRGLS